MFVDLTPEQHALRHKVRDYFQALMTPDMREQLRGKEGGELFRRVYLWARARDEQGRRAMDKAWVRSSLAECYARLEAMRLINMRIAADLEHERMDVALSSTTKVFGSESAIEILRKLAAIVGANGSMRSGSAATLLQGELEYELRSSVTLTFGGGTNEIQRELIAQFGLGMPRAQR